MADSQRGAIITLGIFALLWCGVIGAMVVHHLGTTWTVLDARQRWREVPGTVLASRVEAVSDDGGTTGSPRISYRYAVGDRVFTGERIRLGNPRAEDGPGAAELVAGLPVDAAVVVHYDPRQPQEAALDLDWPQGYWFAWVILQPLLAVCGLALSALPMVLRAEADGRRCRAGGWAVGWRVPGWGAVRAAGDGAELGGRPAWAGIAVTVLVTHGALWFTVLVLLFIAGGIAATGHHLPAWPPPGPDPAAERAAVAIAVVLSLTVGAAVLGLRHRRLRRPLLRLDPVRRHLMARAPDGAREVPWSMIEAWELRPGRVLTEDEDTPPDLVLFLVVAGQPALRLGSWPDRQLARHIATELARATCSAARLPRETEAAPAASAG